MSRIKTLVKKIYTVGRDKQPMCKITIDGKQVEMLIDSGASVDLIDEKTFRELYKDKKQAPENTKHRIFSYGSPIPLLLLGTIQAELSANVNSTQTTLHKGEAGNLLGYNTAKQLGVLKTINQMKTDETSPQFPASGEFECLFGGIGKVKGKVIKLHTDPDVKPKQQPHRRVPFHV